MPLQATSGAASYDAFGGGAAAKVNYIEDFFQSYLRTGTGASATVTTGLDGSTKETLVWTKSRSAATNHKLTDNVRGATKALSSNTTGAEATDSQGLTAFSATGYTLGTNTDYNNSGATYVDWQWIAQAKFFDVVTYTGNGTAGRTVAHNLGSTPGCIIVKCTSSSAIWSVYHRSTGATKVGILNDTNAFSTVSAYWNDTEPTSTVFTVGSAGAVNGSGDTYVAYLFAHNAGGFGLTGTDNVISCGSFTSSGIGLATVDLGYEPQWILYKGSNGVTNWQMVDNMRGFVVGAANAGTSYLNANTSGAEATTPPVGITNTGFNFDGAANITYIYIAIRRGPMKVPTSGTSVFTPSTASSGTSISVGFPSDLWIGNNADGDGSGNNHIFATRLQGQAWLRSPTTNAETAASGTILWDLQNSFKNNQFGGSRAEFLLGRAPGFMDVVCYTGDSVQGRTITHNLGVKPELMFVKSRSNAISWQVYSATETATKYMLLDSSQSSNTASFDWNNTEPTSSVFTVQGTGGTGLEVNWTGYTYIAYLFATLAGVSKVGSYTGTGTTKQIDCGFTGGARLILIKRTDSTGDWYIYNSASGISSGNDPYMLMNTTAAQVTGTDYIDTYSAGFEISSAAPSGINASGGTFIFLAIA